MLPPPRGLAATEQIQNRLVARRDFTPHTLNGSKKVIPETPVFCCHSGRSRETPRVMSWREMDVISTLALTTAGWAILIGLSVVSALIHEAGHAVAWSLIGAEVREVGYASPGGPALRFKLGSLTFAFNPFAVYAYTLVETPGEQLRNMTRGQRIFVHGAGIMANLLAAALFLLVSGAVIHLFAAFSASLAVQNAFFRDGRRIFAVLSEW